MAVRLASADPVRVLIFDTYYPAFLHTHYAAHPELAERSYEEQLQSLVGRFFGTSDAYSHHFRQLGHAAWEVIPNCAPLQRAWLREHGGGRRLLRAAASLAPGRARTAAQLLLQRAIARAQVDALQPDVVYCQDLWFFGARELRQMRSEGRLVVGQIASQPPGPELLREYSLITTSFPHYVERFRRLGVESEYLRIGFYDRVLESVPLHPARQYDVVFVGGLNPNVHRAGVRLVESLCHDLSIDVWGYGVDQLPESSPIHARWHGEAWGVDMYRVLGSARIVLNRHIEAAEGFANNMRLYEATGMGAMLLTEEAPNLPELFEPGTEVVTYRSPDELVEKARYYLAHEEERSAIAAAGHARTLREHTYANVIRDLNSILEARLP